jgi:hypothetical protein
MPPFEVVAKHSVSGVPGPRVGRLRVAVRKGVGNGDVGKPVVEKLTVGSEIGVSGGSGVVDGAASAVCVNRMDCCAIAVSTAAVLIALTSAVGAVVQAVRISASPSQRIHLPIKY